MLPRQRLAPDFSLGYMTYVNFKLCDLENPMKPLLLTQTMGSAERCGVELCSVFGMADELTSIVVKATPRFKLSC